MESRLRNVKSAYSVPEWKRQDSERLKLVSNIRQNARNLNPYVK